MHTRVTVVGAGLAGCEAAWQLASRGVPVRLVEMKPGERTPAHGADQMAELVCSNSFRGEGSGNAVGLLKREIFALGSLLMAAAYRTRVPAGQALAVDRRLFSEAVEAAIAGHPLIAVDRRRVDRLPPGPLIVATGPLTDGPLAEALEAEGALLNYHDAIAPLVDADSIDLGPIFRASRHQGPGEEGDYLNCPFDEPGYRRFVEALALAERTPLRDFERAPFFEGCLPVEEMAVRGPLTLAHGPLKPVGLVDPATGRRPFAAVQLRAENLARTEYNLVGFQTRLTRPEQKRVFRLIPGLERAVFTRYGQVHRNSFIDAPNRLDGRLRLRGDERVRIAGQLSGVEGYVESIACGLLAGIFAAADAFGVECPPPPPATALGGLLRYLSLPQARFSPSNVVWSMIDAPVRARGESKKGHRERAARIAERAIGAWAKGQVRLFGPQFPKPLPDPVESEG